MWFEYKVEHLKGLFQPKRFCEAVIVWSLSACEANAGCNCDEAEHGPGWSCVVLPFCCPSPRRTDKGPGAGQAAPG